MPSVGDAVWHREVLFGTSLSRITRLCHGAHGCLAAVSALSSLTCPDGDRDPRWEDRPLRRGQCPEPSHVARSVMARGICSGGDDKPGVKRILCPALQVQAWCNLGASLVQTWCSLV